MKVIGIFLFCLASYCYAQPQADGTDLVETQLANALRENRSIFVAVMDFPNVDGKQSALGKHFAEASIHYLAKKKGVQVVERSQVRQLESEWDLSSSGLISDARVVELGGMLGADVMIWGTLTRQGNSSRIEVYMKAVDTKTGVILSTNTKEISGIKYLRMYNEAE